MVGAFREPQRLLRPARRSLLEASLLNLATICAAERQICSELDMQSQRFDRDRSPVGVVGGIADALKIEGHPGILEHVHAVVRFKDRLGPVVDPTIADEDAESAGGEIFTVHLRQLVSDNAYAEGVLAARPCRTVNRDAGGDGAV